MGTKVQEERECGTGGGTLGPPNLSYQGSTVYLNVTRPYT